MVCKLCGTSNPDTNKFCGECGALLVTQPVQSESVIAPPQREPDPEKIITIFEPVQSMDQEFTEPTAAPRSVQAKQPAYSPMPAGFEPEGKHYTTISGPSFLGLADDSPAGSETSSYLLEDEPQSRSNAGWYIFSFVAIALLAVIGVLEWRAIRTGKLSIPFIHDSAAEAPKPADQTVAPEANAAEAHQPVQASEAPWGSPDAKPQTDDSPSTVSSEDKDATNDAQARLAKRADDLRSQAESKDTSTAASSSGSAPTEEAKEPGAAAPPSEKRPERPIPEPKPDPSQNRMLVAGEKYLYGRGVPRDCSQALIYFRAAAEQGNAPAMSHLGALYASGECTTQNRTMAYTWFRRAQSADPKNEWISKNMNMVWRDMTPQERARISQ